MRKLVGIALVESGGALIVTLRAMRNWSGRVAPYAADDPQSARVSSRTDAFLIRPLSHEDAHQITMDFIATLADPALAEKLRTATAGSMSTARFLQVLSAYPRARRCL